MNGGGAGGRTTLAGTAITAIEPVRASAERIKVRAGRHVVAVLRPADVVELKLRVGDVLDAAQLEVIGQRARLVGAIDAALRLLKRRALTAAELTTRLERKGFEGSSIANAIARLRELGLVDDRAFAAEAIRQTTSRTPAGERLLRDVLERHGVEADAAEDALKEQRSGSAADREKMRQIVQAKLKSMGGLPPLVRARRLMGLLARRGFDADGAEQVIREFVDVVD